jgi:DNA-binding response OmpR family regulator
VRVLVVEDEILLADTVARGLRRQGMAVDVAYDGTVGLEKAAATSYDVCVLDRDLPGVHGDEVCTTLTRTDGRVRVLMLTAASGVDDRVAGLNLGADDYLPKPFAFSELVARIRALERRVAQARPAVLVARDVWLDPARRLARRGSNELSLTTKEFAVLELLMAADGAVVSAEELLERAWDEHADPFTNTVRVTIANLRRKLGEPPVIKTVVGAGYRI